MKPKQPSAQIPMNAKHPTFRSVLWKHRCWCLMIAAICAAGCGIHYYDGRTGTEHLWGVGHLRMRVQEPAEGIQAVIKGVQTTGAKFGVGTEEYGFLIGYDNRRTVFVSPTNAAFVLEWPDASFFNLRVGTNPPFLPKNSNNKEAP